MKTTTEKQLREAQNRDGHSRRHSSTSTETDSGSLTVSWRDDDKIVAAIDVLKRLRLGKNKTLVTQIGTSVISNRSDSTSGVKMHKPILAEQDFTTQGSKGDLGCPFASRTALEETLDLRSRSSNGARQFRPDSLPTPPDLKDLLLQYPVTAEYQAADVVSPPASAQGTASKCPIRLLDKHSPEEVAQYFQSHKHEIPRSHEVCVKRYQTNEESIRQLDAKYGSLVNMIQGLGVKHQPMLEPTDHELDIMQDQRSKEKVERWATNYTESAEAGTNQDNSPDIISDTRSGHFDRPLEDIRVGESPSRPWGVHVPSAKGLALSSTSGEEIDIVPVTSALSDQVPRSTHSELPTVYPFGQRAVEAESTVNVPEPSVKFDGRSPETTSRNDPIEPNISAGKPIPSSSPSSPSSPSFVLNGPIFIGYTAEQAAALLQIYSHPRAA